MYFIQALTQKNANIALSHRYQNIPLLLSKAQWATADKGALNVIECALENL